MIKSEIELSKKVDFNNPKHISMMKSVIRVFINEFRSGIDTNLNEIQNFSGSFLSRIGSRSLGMCWTQSRSPCPILVWIWMDLDLSVWIDLSLSLSISLSLSHDLILCLAVILHGKGILVIFIKVFENRRLFVNQFLIKMT